MRDNSLEVFKGLFKFCFDIDVTASILNEALDYYSFANQKKRETKFNQDEKAHFHYKGKKSYRDEISLETYDYIFQQLQNRLQHNFGYKY